MDSHRIIAISLNNNLLLPFPALTNDTFYKNAHINIIIIPFLTCILEARQSTKYAWFSITCVQVCEQ